MEFWKGIFSLHDVNRRPKGPSLGGNTSFEPFSIRIGATVLAGRVTEKKENIKSHKNVT